MAGVMRFRSAINGFNRKDVVHYIEYLNSTHNSQLEQLNTQLQTAQAELAKGKSAPAADNELSAEVETLRARCAALEEELAQCKSAASSEVAELEAYRRAERTERLARDRAAQIYTQANAVLAEATLQVDQAMEQMTAQLQSCVDSAENAKAQLQEAVSTLYAIRPEE